MGVLRRHELANRGRGAAIQFTQIQMGVSFKLVLYAADETLANRGSQAAYARIAELNSLLSDYDTQSELVRLCSQAPTAESVPVSPELWHVLSRSQSLAERTGGAFDVTVGPFVRLWRRARRSGKMPSEERLQQARQAVGFKWLLLEPSGGVQLLRPGMRLDLGGIAKGYAADEALAVLQAHGIRSALIDASGDIVLGEAPPDGKGWQIGVVPLTDNDSEPSRFLNLSHRAVATSGDAWQFIEIDGTRYSHIVDPRTGLGLAERSSVTIVAPDGITADSLATAVSVLGPVEGLELIETMPHAEGVVVVARDGQVETFESTGMATLSESSAR